MCQAACDERVPKRIVVAEVLHGGNELPRIGLRNEQRMASRLFPKTGCIDREHGAAGRLGFQRSE